MNNELARTRGAVVGPMLVGGFGAALAMACAWFATHLPWFGVQEQVAIPIVLAAWFAVIGLVTGALPRKRSVGVGLGAGAVSGLAGLVFFGSQLAHPADAAGASSGVVPNAALLGVGFVVLGSALGLIGGAVGNLMARPDAVDAPASHWLARFALVACLSIAPLVFIGGLVTSTNSGMAVPDWPRTFGANMFLYPLGSHTDPGKFVEHSHRLFGAFAGLTVLVMLVFTFSVDRRRWARVLALIAFLLVCAQGVLGGLRVVENSRPWALVHGVLAQLTFAAVAALAVALSDHFRALGSGPVGLDARTGRRVKLLCTGTLHASILQLILGAVYRHFRDKHSLWTHIGFSVIVLILAMLAGFTLASQPVRRTLAGPRAAAIGMALATVALAQFFLGWLTLAFGGTEPAAASVGQALLRTLHQANGAFLLALAAAAFVWGKRLSRGAVGPGTIGPAAV